MLTSLLMGLMGCAVKSDKEVQQERQSLMMQLQAKYPDDTFEIKEYYATVPYLFPQSWKFRATKEDLQKAGFYIKSTNYDRIFKTSFAWDDDWTQVTLTEDDYGIVLLEVAQQPYLDRVTLSNYPITMIPRILASDNDLEQLDLHRLEDAVDAFRHSDRIHTRNITLVTVPNATSEETLLALENKIYANLTALNRNLATSEIYFYSDDQIDVSEVEFDLTQRISINDLIKNMEKYYNVDEAYFYIINGHSSRGSRFGKSHPTTTRY